MTPCSISVHAKVYAFDPRPSFPFQVVAKRYWVEHDSATDDPTLAQAREDVLTLVFLHGNGAHKEQWELTIRRLFEHEQAGKTVRFHDMWSLDMPNHGDSAILNEEVLRWGCDTFTWGDNARGVHAFLAGLGTGVDVDFSKRKLALVGHSMGAIVSVLATTFYPPVKFSSFHMYEPFFVGKEVEEFGLQYQRITARRQDVWKTREEAFQMLKTRPIIGTWDERILRIIAEHGLRPLPSAEYPDLKEGVTLKCPRRQEAATYCDRVGCGVAYRYLPHVLKKVPTHITYGMVRDFVPEESHQYTLQVASGGVLNFASVTSMPSAGHMMLQTHPEDIADSLWKTVTQASETSGSLKSTATAKL